MWGEVYIIASKSQTGVANSTRWTKQFVLALWDYAVSLWKFCNGEVHGHSIEESREKERLQLQNRIDMEYRLYQVDPFVVSPQFVSLFTKKSQRKRRKMDRDSLDCWLISRSKETSSCLSTIFGEDHKVFQTKA
jgi:hypothetical protein